ncbi:MAG: hypothetical protein ABIN01_19020 [Ferruginibacter sp.]
MELKKTGVVYNCQFSLNFKGSSKNDAGGSFILEIAFDENPLPVWCRKTGETLSGRIIFRNIKKTVVREFTFIDALVESISGSVDLIEPSAMTVILKLNAKSIRIA